MSTEKIEVVVSMFELRIFDTDDGTLWGFVLNPFQQHRSRATGTPSTGRCIW